MKVHQARPEAKAAVFTLNNEPSGNEVIVSNRNDDGTIYESRRYSTDDTDTIPILGGEIRVCWHSN